MDKFIIRPEKTKIFLWPYFYFVSSRMTFITLRTAMAIITTHSPILVGNLQDSFVRELQRGKVCTKGPRFSFGRDVNSILEDYFRIEERNKGGKALIDAFYDAMNKKDYDEAETLLEKLNKLFGPTDVTTIKATSLFDDLAE